MLNLKKSLFFLISAILANISVNSHLEASISKQTVNFSSKTKSEGARFFDELGREVYFSGWNVSGAVKLKSMNFLPFKNVDDAKKSFDLMRQDTGANIIRFTIAWEGTHAEVDTIDQKYLSDAIAQMKVS